MTIIHEKYPNPKCVSDFLASEPGEKRHSDEIRPFGAKLSEWAESANEPQVALAELTEMLHNSDLSAKRRRDVCDAVVNSMPEGATLHRESVLRLIEFVADRYSKARSGDAQPENR
jgi:hypothetical protein